MPVVIAAAPRRVAGSKQFHETYSLSALRCRFNERLDLLATVELSATCPENRLIVQVVSLRFSGVNPQSAK